MKAFRRAILATPAFALLTACSVPGPGEAPDGIHDPYEARNRKVHEFNRSVDRTFFGEDTGTSEDAPNQVVEDFRPVVANVADTLSLPGTVVNQVLQGRLLDASRNTLRFGVNATLGFGGMFDVADDLMNIPEDDSDFGETLAVWGAPEGAFQMLPVLGPSTQRDTVGMAVDVFLDPFVWVLEPGEALATKGVRLGADVMERAQYSDSVNSVLYESADSYAQLRLIYLQNRRFELGEPAPEAEGLPEDPLALDTEGF